MKFWGRWQMTLIENQIFCFYTTRLVVSYPSRIMSLNIPLVAKVTLLMNSKFSFGKLSNNWGQNENLILSWNSINNVTIDNRYKLNILQFESYLIHFYNFELLEVEICIKDFLQENISINYFQIWRSNFIHWITIFLKENATSSVSTSNHSQIFIFNFKVLSHVQNETNNFRKLNAIAAFDGKKWFKANFDLKSRCLLLNWSWKFARYFKGSINAKKCETNKCYYGNSQDCVCVMASMFRINLSAPNAIK